MLTVHIPSLSLKSQMLPQLGVILQMASSRDCRGEAGGVACSWGVALLFISYHLSNLIKYRVQREKATLGRKSKY